MEILEIIAIVLIVEILIFYIFTVIVKYRNGEHFADIWNIFYSWRNAVFQKNWIEGYEWHEKLNRITMIGDTLTKENLTKIKTAMDNIKEIDR